MTKKKTMKNIKTPNKFDWGGDFKQAFKESFSGKNVGKALPGAIGAIGGAAEGLISNGFSTTGGQVLSGIGDVAGAIPVWGEINARQDRPSAFH